MFEDGFIVLKAVVGCVVICLCCGDKNVSFVNNFVAVRITWFTNLNLCLPHAHVGHLYNNREYMRNISLMNLQYYWWYIYSRVFNVIHL